VNKDFQKYYYVKQQFFLHLGGQLEIAVTCIRESGSEEFVFTFFKIATVYLQNKSGSVCFIEDLHHTC